MFLITLSIVLSIGILLFLCRLGWDLYISNQFFKELDQDILEYEEKIKDIKIPIAEEKELETKMITHNLTTKVPNKHL